MEVLIISHFSRGQSFGGSQRATAIAERLEERGAAVTWIRIDGTDPPLSRRLRSSLRLRPPVLDFHDRPVGDLGAFDVAIAMHSYMARYLQSARSTTSVVDFHNLEWVYLGEIARQSDIGRKAFRYWQSLLTKRYEAKLAREIPMSTFCTSDEMSWAMRQGAGVRAHLVPNVLPAADIDRARRVRERRNAQRSRSGRLLYLGTLTYPPNALSLQAFLESDWPEIVERNPSVCLDIVGRGPDSLLADLGRHENVNVLGFVEDLDELLAGAPAAILPVYSGGGSSLRTLLLALAGVPMIGTERAFRGVEWLASFAPTTTDEWSDAISAVDDGATSREVAMKKAEVAEAMQGDRRPWDDWFEALKGSLR